MFKIKKATSPVVSISLLLVVSVLSVISFQSWFNNFSSSIFIDVENQITSGDLSIEGVFSGYIYINNNVKNNLSINELQIGNNKYDLNQNLSLGLNKINIIGCIQGLLGDSQDIILVTNNKLVEKI